MNGIHIYNICIVDRCYERFCGKKISGLVSSVKGTFYMNVLRMLMCIVVGFFVVATNGISAFETDLKTLMITAVSGISTAMFVVSWIFCVRRGAYVMIDVFLMLGGGLTIGLCKLFFNESVSTNQLIGFILLVIASYIIRSGCLSFRTILIVAKSSFILKLCVDEMSKT